MNKRKELLKQVLNSPEAFKLEETLEKCEGKMRLVYSTGGLRNHSEGKVWLISNDLTEEFKEVGLYEDYNVSLIKTLIRLENFKSRLGDIIDDTIEYKPVNRFEKLLKLGAMASMVICLIGGVAVVLMALMYLIIVGGGTILCYVKPYLGTMLLSWLLLILLSGLTYIGMVYVKKLNADEER